MSRVVFRQVLLQIRRPLMLLPAAAAVFYYLIVLGSSSFARAGGTGTLLSRPPRFVQAFVGGDVDFFSPSGWVAAGMGHPVTLALLSAAALVVSAGAVAAEVERGTIDLVLCRPVSRRRFLLAKAAAALVAVTATEAGGFIGVGVARLTVDGVDELAPGPMLRAFTGSWLLFVALSMIALAVSARLSLSSRSIGISVGMVLTAFFLNVAALLVDALSGLRYMSPFHYFRASAFLAGDAIAADVAVLAGVAATSLAAALFVFQRRDLAR